MAKKKILIVDDEPDFVSMVRMRLEANDYDVIEASSGMEGLTKTVEEHPDLILLDVMMPGKDGYTMLRELKRKEEVKGIPVIVITAKPGMGDLFRVEGVEHYIVKPFETEDLLSRIEEALNK
jgi:DNA-binding response OmpR family regulator